ncbi:UDP-4-amino-4,6-dideoxy-N-acetyl-beta-L-altrosamine N-acetyltransferase [Zavarzinia sp.]|uniref:UDP-4-amino-4, 6-dideoxy-N-acetyl-beta-L-altrosamine N-acetyltransferase n=1 Tax=Zavarzinia sp. TaxID=2027920 RepID=UPI0035695746
MSDTVAPRPITLKPIVECSRAQQEAIRDIRNQPAIRAAMYSDHVIGEAEHFAWLERLRGDERQLIFAVLDDTETPLGIVSVNAWDRRHKRSDWAFYLDAAARGGLGAALEFFFLDFVFDTLGIEKLNCEVLETNPAVVALHRNFGFAEEGFRRANVEKDGRRIGVHFLGLTREEWHAGRAGVAERFADKLARFSIALAPAA